MKTKKQFALVPPGGVGGGYLVFDGVNMYTLEDAYRNPYSGKWPLVRKEVSETCYYFELPDGRGFSLVSVDGVWLLEDLSKPLIRRGRVRVPRRYKTFGRAVNHVELEHLKVVSRFIEAAAAENFLVDA